jgi:hypothetical protein
MSGLVGISYPATFEDTGKPTLKPLAHMPKVPPISVHMEGLFWVFDCSYRQEPGANEAI